MKANIEKGSGRSLCRGKNCPKNPEQVDCNGRILKGTICAAISIHGAAGYVTAYYCENCIEDVLFIIRKELDLNLILFK